MLSPIGFATIASTFAISPQMNREEYVFLYNTMHVESSSSDSRWVDVGGSTTFTNHVVVWDQYPTPGYTSTSGISISWDSPYGTIQDHYTNITFTNDADFPVIFTGNEVVSTGIEKFQGLDSGYVYGRGATTDLWSVTETPAGGS